jgi:hypothetical protein
VYRPNNTNLPDLSFRVVLSDGARQVCWAWEHGVLYEATRPLLEDFPMPIERIESLHSLLRFRVSLGDGTHKLGVLR